MGGKDGEQSMGEGEGQGKGEGSEGGAKGSSAGHSGSEAAHTHAKSMRVHDEGAAPHGVAPPPGRADGGDVAAAQGAEPKSSSKTKVRMGSDPKAIVPL